MNLRRQRHSLPDCYYMQLQETMGNAFSHLRVWPLSHLLYWLTVECVQRINSLSHFLPPSLSLSIMGRVHATEEWSCVELRQARETFEEKNEGTYDPTTKELTFAFSTTIRSNREDVIKINAATVNGHTNLLFIIMAVFVAHCVTRSWNKWSRTIKGNKQSVETQYGIDTSRDLRAVWLVRTQALPSAQ